MKIDFGEPNLEGEAKRLLEALKQSMDEQIKRTMNDVLVFPLIVDVGEMKPGDVLKLEVEEAKPFTMPIDYVEIKQEKIVVCRRCRGTAVWNGAFCTCRSPYRDKGKWNSARQRETNVGNDGLVIDLDKSEYHYIDEEVEISNSQTTQMEKYHGKE